MFCIKIIKNSSIGDFAYNDQDNDANYDTDIDIADWNNSTLKNYLNTTYLNTLNSTTQNMILPSTWYLRGNKSSSVSKEEMFNIERTTGTIMYNTPYITNTKIGIMYPSDYGFAVTEGGNCTSSTKINYYDYCTGTNWLFTGLNEWQITPYDDTAGYAYYTYPDGYIHCYYKRVSTPFMIRPTLYLKGSITLKDGQGTINSPYIISL